MNKEYFEIKDKCRAGLLKYLGKAILIIPDIPYPKILDAGCGTGVPALFVSEKIAGELTTVDTDTVSINILRKKVTEYKLTDRIHVINCSLFDIKPKNTLFDLIIAEGILNAVGFQKGFKRILELSNEKGYIIIHDEYKDLNKKIELIKKHNCRLLDSFVLDENIWWNDYFKCLEKEISFVADKELLKLFKSDIEEIKMFKKNPYRYTSAYFIIEKN